MADPRRVRLDDDDVESGRQRGQSSPVRQRPVGEHRPRGVADPPTLAVVDGFLRQAEASRGAEADLDDDESARRARVDRHEIELVATDMDVSGQDGPTLRRQAFCDEGLGAVAGPLRRCPGTWFRLAAHLGILADGPYVAVDWRSPRSLGNGRDLV
jgi:hypothetical protein